MIQLKIYRILTFILIPFAIYAGMEGIVSIFAGFGNPLILLPAAIMICVAIYVFASNIFLNKGIIKSLPCKESLKDWIKVNAIVTIIFAILMFISTLVILLLLSDQKLLQQLVHTSISNQPAIIQQNFTEASYLQLLKNAVYILLPVSIILITHIIITFRLMKKYKQVFK